MLGKYLFILAAVIAVIPGPACMTTNDRRNYGSKNVQLVLDATELASAFEKSEVNATGLYTRKRARISGFLSKLEPLPDGRMSIIFRTSTETFRPVRCVFGSNTSDGLNEPVKGDPITVAGRIAGFTDSGYFVSVEDCVIEMPQN